MEYGTKGSGARQGRSVAFGFRKGCHFTMISNRATASISDAQGGLCNLFHVGKDCFHIAKLTKF
eukprot:8666159-Ditylum_brightwellii.AAC.1